jgi:hypothetical protein
MTAQLPETAVVRVSPGTFDPARFDEVQAMTIATSHYLIPAIKQLPGLISYNAATSPDGSVVHVSIWESAGHAQQMSRLKEMIVDARGDAERAGVTFSDPIINYAVDWTI